MLSESEPSYHRYLCIDLCSCHVQRVLGTITQSICPHPCVIPCFKLLGGADSPDILFSVGHIGPRARHL